MYQKSDFNVCFQLFLGLAVGQDGAETGDPDDHIWEWLVLLVIWTDSQSTYGSCHQISGWIGKWWGFNIHKHVHVINIGSQIC